MEVREDNDRETTLTLRNRLAGAAIVLAGIYVIFESTTYPMGTSSKMGPGLLPLALGILFILFGLLVAVVNDDGNERVRKIVWRPVVLVLSAVLAFAFLVEPAGLAVATAALVFFSGVADPSHTWKSLLSLFVVLLVSVYLIFGVALGIPFELLPRWI